MNLRPLAASDASAFQRLRLFGLQESPSAFGSSYEEERDRTIEQIQNHLVGFRERVFIGAFLESELIGLVGVGREQAAKARHLAFVRSMYVAPTARCQGLGRNLLLAAIERASSWHGVEQLTDSRGIAEPSCSHGVLHVDLTLNGRHRRQPNAA